MSALSRAIANPEPGFFKMRLVKGGPWVAALVYRPCPLEMDPETFQHIDRWPHLSAEIDGKPASVDRVWTSGRIIPISEYLRLRAAPADRPHEAISVNNMATIF